jgi:hypothetical protein
VADRQRSLQASRATLRRLRVCVGADALGDRHGRADRQEAGLKAITEMTEDERAAVSADVTITLSWAHANKVCALLEGRTEPEYLVPHEKLMEVLYPEDMDKPTGKK